MKKLVHIEDGKLSTMTTNLYQQIWCEQASKEFPIRTKPGLQPRGTKVIKLKECHIGKWDSTDNGRTNESYLFFIKPGLNKVLNFD